jgi:hypothetical protein
MADKPLAELLEEYTERCRNMDAPLADRLQAFADEVRKLTPDFADVVDRMVGRLRAADAGTKRPSPATQCRIFSSPINVAASSSLRIYCKGARRHCLPPRPLVPVLPNKCQRAGRHPPGCEGTWR